MNGSSFRGQVHCTLVALLFAVAGCSGEDPAAPVSTASGGGGSSGAGQGGGGASQGGGGAGTSGASSGGAAGGASAGAAGNAGSTTGGSGGSAGSAGSGGNGGGDEPGYVAPPRDIVIQEGRGNVTISFTPADAASGATSFHGGEQQARFDEGAAKVQKKLVLGLGGIGTGAHNGGGLGWAASRGYHTIGIDYFNSTSGEQGLVYLETWSGEDKSPEADVSPLNSIQNRVKTALVYLQEQDPGADWAYYLDEGGNVRWNDVIIFGYSYGGQTGAAATKYVALHRVVATSAPNIDEEAAWVTDMPNVTPGYRSFTITGTDDGGHDDHLATATRLGWPGAEVQTWMSAPPYDGSSLLSVDFGHSEFCSLPGDVLANADEVCEFAFGYTP